VRSHTREKGLSRSENPLRTIRARPRCSAPIAVQNWDKNFQVSFGTQPFVPSGEGV